MPTVRGIALRYGVADSDPAFRSDGVTILIPKLKRIRIIIKCRVQIHIKVKSGAVEAKNGAKEGRGRAEKGSVEAKNGAVRRVCRPVVAGSLHFNKEQDPDLDPHKKIKVRAGFASKRKVGSDPHKKVKRDPDQHLHQRDADPQHCLLFPVRILNTA